MSSCYANFRSNEIAHICVVPLQMLEKTPNDVISESKKLFVLLSNKLFTAGDIFSSLSGGLIAEVPGCNFRFN